MSVLMILMVIAAPLTSGTEVFRPRGVPLSKVPIYDPTKDFVCLDGSFTIPFMRINDDYCDCRDGSDEPGTSACPNGIFHCSNKGHIALNIRSMMVNDGVCDCCDGSDEWASGTNCSNSCHQLGKKEAEERARLAELARQGYAIKVGLIEQGKNMLQEKINRVAQLKSELEQVEKEKSDLELLKTQAEEPESAALEKYRIAEEARKAEEEQKKAEEEALRQEEEAKNIEEDSSKVEEQPADIDESEASPPANVEMEAEEVDQNEDKEPEKIPEETPQRVVFPGYRGEDDEDPAENVDDLNDNEESDEYEEDGADDAEKEEEESQSKYDDETQALIDAANAAREAFKAAESRFRDLQRDLTNEEASVNRNFGAHQEFRSLEGQCYDYNDHEYTYKLCPFDKAQQIPKHGGATSLGTWGEWIAEDDRLAMKYTNGQGCWNGPNRSTYVRVICGLESKVLAVSEPAKCEYVFQFSTPAACAAPHDSPHGQQHTEL